MQENNRKNMSYSFDIKLKAVKMYLEEGIGSPTIARELNLSSNKRVLLWVKRYNEFGEDGLRERRGTTRGLQKGRPRKRELSLEEENQRLKVEVEFLKKLLILEREWLVNLIFLELYINWKVSII